MLGATRRSGLVAYTPSPRLEAVLRELAAGTPVIVLLNLSGTRLLPVWHYAVLIGYDLEAGHVIARSGKRSRDEWKFGFLEFFWQDSNHWSMLALPPGRLPATAGDQDFALAVAALEQAGGRAQARTSYRALLQRWPDNLVGLIGLANVEYALKDLPAAERALRHAAKAHPQSAVAYNNLAHVLLELGQLRDAEAAARHAVSLAGPTLAEARKTLEAIEARRGSGR
jgi:predicted Zn-dependent protease